MSTTIHTEEDAQRQLQVRVEVAEERVQKQMRATARRIGRGINIPGFRRGKVPYNVLVQRLGREALRGEAVEELISPVFEETMAGLEETPYAQPQLDDVQMEPLVIKFTVPLEPVVELGAYREIRRDVEPVEISEEAVDEALEQVRERHQVVEPVDRPVMEGDMVALSGTGEVVEEDRVEVIFDEEREELLMDPTVTFPGTDFVANLIGLEVGDEAEFTITLPEADDEDEEEEGDAEETDPLAGKEAQFSIIILDVKSRYLPELDDELAQEEGDYETLAELREAVREELRQQAESEAQGQLLDDFIDEMAEQVEELVYPPAVVEEDIDRRIESLRQQVTRAGWKWENYLMLQGTTEASLRAEMEEGAVESVERGLVFRRFVELEKLLVSEDELDEAIDERLDRFGDGTEELGQQIRDFFRQGEGLEMVSSEILMDKVYERVEAIVTGNAPDLAELEAQEVTDEEE